MTAGRCNWSRPCPEPALGLHSGRLLEYCYEHECEVTWNRAHPTVEVDARTNARADIDLVDEARLERVRVTVGPELEAFLRLSKKRQLTVGRKARQAASKTEVVDVPTCERCDRPSVFDVCTRCEPSRNLVVETLKRGGRGPDRAGTL